MVLMDRFGMIFKMICRPKTRLYSLEMRVDVDVVGLVEELDVAACGHWSEAVSTKDINAGGAVETLPFLKVSCS